MPHHYTKNTITAQEWCTRCNRYTDHRIDRGRRGPCLECMDRRELTTEELIEREAFEERAAIKQYCGNMPRLEAEQQAREEIRAARGIQQGLFV